MTISDEWDIPEKQPFKDLVCCIKSVCNYKKCWLASWLEVVTFLGINDAE